MKIYYNDIKIVDNKYIDGFGTLLWNKQKEIELFLNKKNIHFIDNNLNLNKIYNDYLSDVTERTMKVSKKYFMEYLSEKSLFEEENNNIEITNKKPTANLSVVIELVTPCKYIIIFAIY